MRFFLSLSDIEDSYKGLCLGKENSNLILFPKHGLHFVKMDFPCMLVYNQIMEF